MLDPHHVPDVATDELLARFILQSSHIRRSNQTVKQDAFIPHPHTDLSVTRHLGANETELWDAGREVAAQTGKTLHGRADLRAAVALNQKLVVLAKPIAGNPNHADISNWPADKSLQKIIAQELAAVAVFVGTPVRDDEAS